MTTAESLGSFTKHVRGVMNGPPGPVGPGRAAGVPSQESPSCRPERSRRRQPCAVGAAGPGSYKPVIFNHGATRISKTCDTWPFNQGHWPLLPYLDCQKNDNSQNNSRPVWMNQNYTCLFGVFVRLAKMYFWVCCRILVISLCVPWREQGWKSLL